MSTTTLRRLAAGLLGAAALTAGIASAATAAPSAGSAGADPLPGTGGSTAAADARYVITLTSIKAVNETGPDWLGSDEIYGGMRVTDPSGRNLGVFRSQLLKGFDSGETKSLAADKNCAPARQIFEFNSGRSFLDARAGDRWGCEATAAQPLAIAAPFLTTVNLWEDEGCPDAFGDCEFGRNDPLGHWELFDQDLGRGQLSFSTTGLAADLPAVGMERTYTIAHTGSGASYRSVVGVRRVQ